MSYSSINNGAKQSSAASAVSIVTLCGLIFAQTFFPCFATTTDDSLSRAKALYNSTEFKKATRECSLWIDTHPDDNEAKRFRAKCYLADGNFEEAVSGLTSVPLVPGPLEQAIENQSTIDANDNVELSFPNWLEALVLLYSAKVSNQRGDQRKAVRLCDKALLKESNFPECLIARATLLTFLSRFYEAEENCRDAVVLRPTDWHTWREYSDVLEHQQKIAQALDAINRSIELSKAPPYPEQDFSKSIDKLKQHRDYLARKKK